MEQKITQIFQYNIGQLLGLLDSMNVSDTAKKAIKSYFWKAKEEIVLEMKKREVENEG